jgi:hypothetical protein
MRDQSAGDSQGDFGERDLLGRSTILEILYQEGEQLVAAQRARASEILEEAPEPEREAVLVPLDLGVPRGQRRWLVLGDGAKWIRDWFESLRLDHKVIIIF